MSFDGQAEAEAILAHGKTLVSGRFTESLPDNAVIEKNPDQSIKPRVVVSIGEPYPNPLERGMGVGEVGQPYLLPVTFTSMANSDALARKTSADVFTHFLDWAPNEPNSSELRAAGTNQFSTRATASMPSRYARVRHMVCDINLATGTVETPQI